MIAEFAFTAEGKVYQFNAIHLDAFNEPARRLKEAQQKIELAKAEALEEIPAMIRDFCADEGWHEIVRIPNL